MKLKELVSYIWNELEIPVTKLEIQNGVNELFDEIRKGELTIQKTENNRIENTNRRFSVVYDPFV